MPNSAAADIYQKCLQWNDIGYINFTLSHNLPKYSSPLDRPLFIKKDNNYWKWRLNIDSSPSLVSQMYRWRNIDLQQILYINPDKIPKDMGLIFHLICQFLLGVTTNTRRVKAGGAADLCTN